MSQTEQEQLFERVCMQMHVVFNDNKGTGHYNGTTLHQIQSNVRLICDTSAYGNFLTFADSIMMDKDPDEFRHNLEELYTGALFYCNKYHNNV